MVVGAAFGIDVEGHRMARADRVKADAALEAGAGAAAELALHLVLGDEIAGLGRHMQEAVDLACRRCRCLTPPSSGRSPPAGRFPPWR